MYGLDPMYGQTQKPTAGGANPFLQETGAKTAPKPEVSDGNILQKFVATLAGTNNGGSAGPVGLANDNSSGNTICIS